MIYNAQIRAKYSKTRTNQTGQGNPPPPCKASIPPPQTNAISVEQLSTYNNLNLNEVTTTEYNDCIGNFLDDGDQNQNNSSDLEELTMESSDANYDNMSTPLPIVASVGAGDTISDNLIPVHAEYEDNLIQDVYNAYVSGSTLNW